MTVKEKIALFPHSPGVYRYYNAEGKVIYVGRPRTSTSGWRSILYRRSA